MSAQHEQEASAQNLAKQAEAAAQELLQEEERTQQQAQRKRDKQQRRKQAWTQCWCEQPSDSQAVHEWGGAQAKKRDKAAAASEQQNSAADIASDQDQQEPEPAKPKDLPLLQLRLVDEPVDDKYAPSAAVIDIDSPAPARQQEQEAGEWHLKTRKGRLTATGASTTALMATGAHYISDQAGAKQALHLQTL